MKPQGYIPDGSVPGAHEGADLDVGLIARIAAWLGGILVFLILGAMGLFHLFARHFPYRTSEAAPIVTDADLPPAPRLQMDSSKEIEELRAREDRRLNGCAWTDSTQSTARIPIDRAMTLWVRLQAAAPPTGNALPPRPALVSPQDNAPAAATRPAQNRVLPQAAPAAVTELQVRQEKAREGGHAP